MWPHSSITGHHWGQYCHRNSIVEKTPGVTGSLLFTYLARLPKSRYGERVIEHSCHCVLREHTCKSSARIGPRVHLQNRRRSLKITDCGTRTRLLVRALPSRSLRPAVQHRSTLKQGRGEKVLSFDNLYIHGAPPLVHFLWRIRKSLEDSAYLRPKWHLSFLINLKRPESKGSLAGLLQFMPRCAWFAWEADFLISAAGLQDAADTAPLVGPHVTVPTATSILLLCLRPNQVPKIERCALRTRHQFGFLWDRRSVTKSPDIERDDARVGERARFRVGCPPAMNRSSRR